MFFYFFIGITMKTNFLSIISLDLGRLGYKFQGDTVSWPNLLWLFRKRSVRALLYIRCILHGNSLISHFARLRLRAVYTIEISPGTEIGGGLLLPHPQNIIISSGVLLGEGITLSQGVTVGGNQKKRRSEDNVNIYLPRVGNNVWIGPNCVVGGPVKIGDHVLIGANSLVTKDIPSNSMVVGHNKLIKRNIVVDNINNTWSEIE